MTARRPTIQQPRSVSKDLAIQPYFRGSMQAELQKFGQTEDQARQLMLGEDADLLEAGQGVETYGLDLSVSEDKALHAIQMLLDNTNYQGNMPGEEIQSSAYKWTGYLPRLSVTYSEYYEAYGLKQAGDGRYRGAQAEEALLALKSLTETRRISYKRQRKTGTGKASRMVYDVVRVTKPLISITEGFKDLDAEEADQVIAGQDLPQKRSTRLVIEVSPLLVDQIDRFYVLKPKALYTEIQDLLPGRRISRAVSLFIEWLTTLDIQEMRISRDNLAIKLRMAYLLKQRKPALLEKKLQEAFQTAKELEYLLDYREEPIGLLLFTLNPEKCKRVEAKNAKKAIALAKKVKVKG